MTPGATAMLGMLMRLGRAGAGFLAGGDRAHRALGRSVRGASGRESSVRKRRRTRSRKSNGPESFLPLASSAAKAKGSLR